MTAEERDAVKVVLESLYPEYKDENITGYINTLMDLAYTIAKNDGLKDTELITGTALLTLDLLLGKDFQNETNVSTQTIDGVTVSYATNKYDASKWRRFYEMLLNGTYDTEYTSYYVGISG